jgi:hypothetical protein
MKTIAILTLALLATACGGSGVPGQSNVTIVGNGTEPCVKPDCVKHPIDKK